MRPPRGVSQTGRGTVRRGVILPLVMLVMVLVSVILLALQSAGWRAARGARSQWDVQRALYSADLAVVRALGTWAPETAAVGDIGQVHRANHTLPGGWETRVDITRTAPLTAAVRAVTTYSRMRGAVVGVPQFGDAAGVRREIIRLVQLAPPDIPIRAAITALGSITWDSATVDGRAHVAPTGDDCGVTRDSTDIDAILAPAYASGRVPAAVGAYVTAAAGSITPLQQRFDRAWAVLASRSHAVDATLAPSVPPIATWKPTVMTGATRVTVADTVTYVGVLAIDGDLNVRGALHVVGALIVRGALDVSHGQLDVDGAVVVRDIGARNSPLSDATRIRYAPCVLGRALSAVARPVSAPFGVWNSP